MLIYNSMIIWIALMGLSYMWLRQQRKVQGIQKPSVDRVPMIYAILVFGYIIFWAGIRSGVADTATYIQGFQLCPSKISSISQYWDKESKAPGFELLSVLFKSFVSEDYHDWLMTIALVSGIPIMVVLWKKSTNFFYSAFLFIVTLDFFWMFNGIRQFLVVSILFLISDWIAERKMIRFMIAVLLLSTIHYTSLVMIPIYFFVTDKPFGKKMLVFLIALLLSIVFLEPVLATMETVLADTGYGGFSQQFATDDGVNPIRVLVMLLPTLIAFVGRKRLVSLSDNYINLCINMSTISAGVYILGIFTSGILIGRLPIYFELYNLILLPYMFKKCFTKRSSEIMFIMCAVGFLMFYYIQMGNSYYISEMTGLIGG